MADRRITVLNPDGYQEVLQTADRLFVDSISQLAQTNFSGNISGTNGAFTGNLTVQAVPAAAKDVVTLDFIEDVIIDLTLSANLPITLANKVIGINNATNSTVGAVRFATNAEVDARSSVDAAVKPDQLIAILDDIDIDGVAPIVATETTTNNWDISINYATVSFAGAVRFASDQEASTGTSEDRAVNPKQVKAAIDAIPYATSSTDGLVQFATGAEVIAGVSNTVAVTPAQLSQEVNTVGLTVNSPLTISETNRVFDLDINYATDTTDGTIRFATSAEMSAGTSNSVCITPLQLETRLGGLDIVDGSTTEKGLVRFATNAETATGTEPLAAVSPASMRYALDQTDYVLDGGTY